MNSKSAASTVSDDEFLSEFYRNGNALKWDAYTNRSMGANTRESLRPWIEAFQARIRPRLLPRVHEMSQQSCWYAFAENAKDARGLREQLTAFLGPTYTDFHGQLAEFDASDPVDHVCATKFGPFVFKLNVLSNQDRDIVAERLRLMQALDERRPEWTLESQKPIGRLIRDLEMAIVVGNEPSAWACYDGIRSRGRLSAHNLSFLQIRIHAAFGRWAELLTLPRTDDLVRVHRPVRVTEALLSAVYEVRFRKFENSGDVAQAVSEFRARQPEFGTLFQSWKSLKDRSALKAHLLRAVASVPLTFDQVEVFAEQLSGGVDSSWVASLVDFARRQTASMPPTQLRKTSEEQAKDAIDKGDFDGAFQLLLQTSSSVCVLRQVVEVAVEIGSLRVARQALEFFDSAPEQLRAKAQERRTTSLNLDELRRRTAAPVATKTPRAVTNWMDWFQALDDETFLEFAADVVRAGSVEWSVESELVSAGYARQIADQIIRTRPPSQYEVVRNAVPVVIGAFLPDDRPLRPAKPIYKALTEVIIFDSSIGSDDLEALEKLAEAILQCGPNAADGDFTLVLDIYKEAWAQRASIHHLDWAMNGIDLLIEYGVPQHANVADFFSAVVNSIRACPRRLESSQWELLGYLALDLDLSLMLHGLRPNETAATQTPQIPKDVLGGTSVAIYSLTERIATRAKQMIEKHFSGITFHLCHDHACTDRLRNLARSVDIFLVNKWDAKHAATNAIHDNRDPNQATLHPKSKSAASLLETLLCHVGNI